MKNYNNYNEIIDFTWDSEVWVMDGDTRVKELFKRFFSSGSRVGIPLQISQQHYQFIIRSDCVNDLPAIRATFNNFLVDKGRLVVGGPAMDRIIKTSFDGHPFKANYMTIDHFKEIIELYQFIN